VVADVRDCSPRFGDLDTVLKGLVGAERFDSGVDALSVREVHDSLDRVHLAEVHDVVGSVLPCEFLSMFDSLDGDDLTCALQCGPLRRHQPDWALCEHRHRPAHRDVSVFRGSESRTHHISRVGGLVFCDTIRDVREIPIRVVHVDVLRERPVLDVCELPATQRAVRLRGVSVLCSLGVPVRRYRADCNSVAGLEVAHVRSDFLDDADDFVPEREILALADRSMHGMAVGRTDQSERWPNDSVCRTRFGPFLLRDTYFTNTVHHKCFHGFSLELSRYIQQSDCRGAP
jgi:hypothetical protein